MNYRLSSQIALASVALTVRDLERAMQFYQRVIGLQILAQTDGQVTLGAGDFAFLELHENPQAQKTRGTTGLYHFAILVPQRANLAEALQRIIQTETPVQGFADHGVSEAIYLADPDGNGIEIYRDRPRQEWPFVNGQIQMVTDPLDLGNLLAELNGNLGRHSQMPTKTTIGHIHLHVRDVPEAIVFYRDVLGFNLIQRYGPSAAFLAAGDYHHHIGINTWAGAGAEPPPAGSIGLRSFSINLPGAKELETLEQNIRQAGKSITLLENGLQVPDPSGNYIQFRCP